MNGDAEHTSPNDAEAKITVSIVSHNHGKMIIPLIQDLLGFPEIDIVIVTHNVPEEINLPNHPKILQRWNQTPKGFGENHNNAFSYCAEGLFCVLNPDIEFLENPFPSLAQELRKSGCAMVAPKVVDRNGRIEDSARHFPTVGRILKKVLGFSDSRHLELSKAGVFQPDCVAGMFMLFRNESFEQLEGFDTRYFLYYEDMDICARIWKAGASISLLTSAVVIHNAQRKSHKSIRFLRWHLYSMILFFYLHIGRLPRVPTG